MSVHINLLPEARLVRLRDQARKRLVSAIAGLTGGILLATIVVFAMLQVFLISTFKINETKMADLKKEIDKSHDIEQQSANLQANLAAFSLLNSTRLHASKIFTNLTNAITPGVKLTAFQISEENLVTVSGTAASFAEVSSFAQALSEYNLNYKPQPDLERKRLFSEVNITAISKDTSTNQVNFSMSFKTDTSLFISPKSGSGGSS